MGTSAALGSHHEWLLIIYLTICALGLQVLWSTEMGQASPYLLSLGMSKSAMAIVFLAGPLSGLVMQPLVGIYADACKHPMGRRRPFIILGTLVAILSIVLFVWARELVGLVLTSGSQLHRTMSIWLASLAFYAMDFSLNVVMAAARSLLVDILPSEAQARAHAYNSRIAGAGSVAIHALSQADLPALLNTPSLSQLKLITIFAIVVFASTQAITCLKIRERPMLHQPSHHEPKLTELVGTLYKTWIELEGSLVRLMCWVLFWCSIGWFPILFYSSTWIGEVWAAGRTLGDDREEATRVGSLALLSQALVAFVTSVALPLFFSEPGHARSVALAKVWAYAQVLLCFLLLFSWVWSRSLNWAILMIALTGGCWAVTIWVPPTLLAQEILAGPNIQPKKPHRSVPSHFVPLTPITEESRTTGIRTSLEEQSSLLTRANNEDEGETSSNDEEALLAHEDSLFNSHDDDDDQNMAGTIFGIQNVFVVMPQFVMSMLATVVFWAVKKSDGQGAEDGPAGITGVFMVGGAAAGVGGVLCWKLADRIRQNPRRV